MLLQMCDDVFAACVPSIEADALCPAVHALVVRKQAVDNQQPTPGGQAKLDDVLVVTQISTILAPVLPDPPQKAFIYLFWGLGDLI